jgi:hypothetical protein
LIHRQIELEILVTVHFFSASGMRLPRVFVTIQIVTLDERLEALAQSVELLSRMHNDNERRMAQMMDAITRLDRGEGPPGPERER